MDEKLDNIYLKEDKLKNMKIINMSIAIISTLIGTIGIVSLLNYLINYLNISYFLIFLSGGLLSMGYSSIIKIVLNKNDKKINRLQREINTLKEEFEKDNELVKINSINDIKSRFNGLSIDNQLKLLYFIRNNISGIRNINELDNLDYIDIRYISKKLDDIDNNDMKSKKR